LDRPSSRNPRLVPIGRKSTSLVPARRTASPRLELERRPSARGVARERRGGLPRSRQVREAAGSLG
jgi:hypothetical protein